MGSNGQAPPPLRHELAATRASLIARLQSLGAEKGWEEFFERYQSPIYGRLIHYGLAPQEAEDVFMEIVEGVARRMPDFVYDPKRCTFRTWLFRIVRFRVANYFRSRARSLPQVEIDADSHAKLEEVPDPASVEPDKRWEEEWEANLVRMTLQRVGRRANPRYMQIYLYSEVDGHSVSETARHLQTTENDVSVAKHRIKELMREEGGRILKEQNELWGTGGSISTARAS